MAEAYFLTVNWCNKSGRGIFCNQGGGCFRKDSEPHSELEMQEILDAFWIILHPQSLLFTEEEAAEFTYYRPLGEYSGQYGIALKEGDVPIRFTAKEDQDDALELFAG